MNLGMEKSKQQRTHEDSSLLALATDSALEAKGATVVPATIPTRAAPMVLRTSERELLPSVTADIRMVLRFFPTNETPREIRRLGRTTKCLMGSAKMGNPLRSRVKCAEEATPHVARPGRQSKVTVWTMRNSVFQISISLMTHRR